MAKRIRKNRFKALKQYWIVVEPYKLDQNPNVYMRTWTVAGEWTSSVTSNREPRVYYTHAEAESAALLLAAKFPEKAGRLEVMQYSRDQGFEQIAEGA